MIKVCNQNKSVIIDKIRSGNIDAVAQSTTNFVDDIILSMYKNNILDCLTEAIPDKRADNTTIPFNLILAMSVAAKMKTKTSLTDIPYAITDHRVLAELGYSLVDDEGSLKTGLMRESSLRFLIGKYNHTDLFRAYNNTVQNHIMPRLDIVPDIHILDCTQISVNLKNENYEQSGIARDKEGDIARGYKLATLRGLTNDNGIIEDTRFGAINTHDLELSREMLFTSPVFKNGDILINDKGFLSREVINFLKNERGVDTYVPLRTNMDSYYYAVKLAQAKDKWINHPNVKRKKQKITFVDNLGAHWQSDNEENDVDFNACVVWDTETDDYFAFITTDTSKTARQIIMTYELRPEIEEDYRQLKEFWQIEDFKSTKINVIAFHIIMVLFGYLFFELFTMMEDGEEYSGKSLPVVLKNYVPQNMFFMVFYFEDEFGILSVIEFADLYSSCPKIVKDKLTYLINAS